MSRGGMSIYDFRLVLGYTLNLTMLFYGTALVCICIANALLLIPINDPGMPLVVAPSYVEN